MKLSKSLTLLHKIKSDNNCDKEYVLHSKPQYPQLEACDVLDAFSSEDIMTVSSKIKELQDNNNLYQRRSGGHGKTHIENVMLFAMIIAKLEDINKDDINLLLEAALYHDEGRVNDFDELHGVNSAVIARKLLKGKYNTRDIKIIESAIIFHDDRTSGSSIQDSEDKGFNKIALNLQLTEEEKIRERRIGNILKDADALDRTRFVHDAMIDEQFLRTNTSKKLIKLAYELNEQYALESLDFLLEKEQRDVTEEVREYQDKLSPLRAKKYYIINFYNKKNQQDKRKV